MQNSRLFHLLEIFNTREIRELQQFIQCELFHTNRKQFEKVVQLFSKLISPRFKLQKPDRRSLAIDLFGDNRNADRRLSIHISQGIDLVQKYLIYKDQTEDSTKYNLALLSALDKKKALRLFNQLRGKIERDLENVEQKDSNYFFYRYVVAKDSLLERGVRNKNLMECNEDFKSAIENLDLFFLINQLNYACQTININHILHYVEYQFPLLEIIVQELPQTPYFRLPLVQIYWNAYKLLVTNEKKYYISLKELLFNHYIVLSEYYQFNFSTNLQNYCVQKINAGNPSYFAEFWEISLFQIEKNILKKLTLASYKNLITTGVMLALKQETPNFTEVLQFIEQHTEKLPLEYREEAEIYGQSYIAFYQNNFKTIPQKLIISQEEAPLTIYKFEDIYYQIDARRLLVMTFFCLDEDDNFDKLCNNLSVFLNERKDFIPEIEVTKNRQFLIIIKKLFWLHGNRTETQQQLFQLKKEIEECLHISDRTWLLKQIENKMNK